MKVIHLCALCLMLITAVIGCKSGSDLIISGIIGPSSVPDDTSVEFSVDAQGDSGITYLWSVDPPNAGTFDDPTLQAATFNSAIVVQDTQVTIVVVVTSEKSGPVIREFDIVVTEHGLVVGEIEGPSTVDEESRVNYSISALGDPGITYLWSNDTHHAGSFIDETSPETEFSVWPVKFNSYVTISVTVDSPYSDPVTRSMQVHILNSSYSEFPDPFVGASEYPIRDIAIEGDGDIVIATEDSVLLFTPYGVLKRSLAGGNYVGLATSSMGAQDTGRGIMGLSPDDCDCNPVPLYDDMYVQGGLPYVHYNEDWWGGDPDPYYPGIAVPIASTSRFSSCDSIPHGIAYHPQTAVAFQKVYVPECLADPDEDWPITNAVPINDYGILAYHPDAPLPPDYMTMIFEGGVDYFVYYDYPTYYSIYGLSLQVYHVPPCAYHCNIIIWDVTDPNFMSDRNGIQAANIGDFEFDALGRLIMAMPNADSVIITDPVVFGDAIVVDKILGWRQNGLGVLPGEFTYPTAIAIDPRNQNILVSDTGNGRIQVFDNDGNFMREVGGSDEYFEPGAIRVDAFGAIYVANVCADRPDGDNLRIYNEYGAPVNYGAIHGTVFDADTGDPVDDVTIRVQSGSSSLVRMTDENGWFDFPVVPSGSHTLIAEKFGYESYAAHVVVNGGYKTTINFYLERIMVPPHNYGVVLGSVFSTITMEPVAGLSVEIVGFDLTVETDIHGEFIFYYVPEGQHLLRIRNESTIYYEQYFTVTTGGISGLGTLYLPIP